MKVSVIFDFEYSKPPNSFAGFICEEYDEVAIEEYGRIKGDRMECMDCTDKIEPGFEVNPTGEV